MPMARLGLQWRALSRVSRVIHYTSIMSQATIRDLRNHGGEVLDRVAKGERVTITRDGRPVAELRPINQPRVSAEGLLARWRHLPMVDAASFRKDVDEALDARL